MASYNNKILDWPRLPDDTIVIWWWNQIEWPHGAREVKYLTDKKRDAMRDYALFSISYGDAKVFETEEQANAFLKENEEKRPHPYGDLNITTVAELREMVKYPASPIMEPRRHG